MLAIHKVGLYCAFIVVIYVSVGVCVSHLFNGTRIQLEIIPVVLL